MSSFVRCLFRTFVLCFHLGCFFNWIIEILYKFRVKVFFCQTYVCCSIFGFLTHDLNSVFDENILGFQSYYFPWLDPSPPQNNTQTIYFSPQQRWIFTFSFRNFSFNFCVYLQLDDSYGFNFFIWREGGIFVFPPHIYRSV